jgi:hypothetical protein
MRKAIAISVTLIAALSAIALADGIGPFSAFKNGIGARALAMGGAFVAVADDASAPLWNPAGLAQITGTRLTGMSTGLSALGSSNQYVGAVTTLADIGVGFSWNRSAVDGGLLPSVGETFVGSLATNVFGTTLAGANLKYYRAADSVGADASGFGFDLGVLVNLDDMFVIGVNAMDLSGATLAWNGGNTDEITSLYKAGMAMKMADDRVVLATDVDFDGTDVTDTHVGVEYQVIDRLALRGGVVLTDNFQEYYFAVGAGINVGGLYVDAAYILEEDEGNTLVISAETEFTLGERSNDDNEEEDGTEDEEDAGD